MNEAATRPALIMYIITPISAGAGFILAEAFRCIPQSLQANAWIVF
jgi:hypothetical protein